MTMLASLFSPFFLKQFISASGHSSEEEHKSHVTTFWLILSPAVIAVVLWLGVFLNGHFGTNNWQTNCISVLLYSFIYFIAYMVCEILSYSLLKEKTFASIVNYDDKDRLKNISRFCFVYGFALICSLLTNAVLLASIKFFGHLWWLVPSLGFLGWSLVRLVIQHIFTSENLISEPLVDDELTEHLYELADKAGFPTIQLHRLNENSGFADKLVFVAPIEKTARIHFSHDVLTNLSKEEIAVLFAHELGHLKSKDIRTRGALGALLNVGKWFGIALILYLVNGYTSSAYLTLAVVTCGGILMNAIIPFVTGLISRYNEKRADIYALELTGDPTSFKSAFRFIVNLLPINSSNFVVEFLYATHPSVDSRIACATKWQSLRQ